jgi:adenylate kinase
MIIFVGPPGSGKSVQGQLLSARNGWRWVSAGQLLRDSKDPDVYQHMTKGEMVNNDLVNKLVGQAIIRGKDITHLVLDGYPRELDQAKWLVGELPKHERNIAAVIVLNVPNDEISRRLKLRGRLDDSEEVVAARAKLYSKETQPILDFFKSLDIPVRDVNGFGSVGQVHDHIQQVIDECLAE